MDENQKKTAKSKVAEREEQTLAFWEKEKIFEKSLKQTEGKEEFVFYDGPPFANGLPHYGHLVPTVIKDAIPRYKTMRGFHVPRRWGWDCHGLPVENLVEKELGLSSKKDIEVYGLAKFNQASAKSVMRYADDWRKIVPRLGRWVDMEADYRTMDTSYTESVWWSFKTLYNKGLIYEGFKSMHLCPHCETTLSNFEVTQGYKDTTDLSVTAKFKLLNFKTSQLPTFLLAWTTTPWTLPGNVALAVNPKTVYGRFRIQDSGFMNEEFILSKDRAEAVLKAYKYEIVGEMKGEELIGLSYEPIFDYYSQDSKLKNRENGWKIYPGDFVTTEDGTGIVHIAPAFGEDDYQLSLKFNLPFVQHVSTNGIFKPEVKDFPSLSVKPKDDPTKTDVEVIKFLAHAGKLFAKEKFTHSYPFCWRCDTPLINYAASSWFVRVSSFKDKLVEANKKVNWVPADIKDGRFGKWLEGARDWAISRSRFWGAPLPVWRCDKCAKLEVVGSLVDLEKFGTKPRNKFLVMRHGEATSNIEGIVCSSLDCDGLTSLGVKQVLESAEDLKGKGIDLIITSPLSRTKETAEIVRKVLNLPETSVITDENFHEISFGVFEKKPISEYHDFFKNPKARFDQRPEGGESEADVRKRVGRSFFELESKCEGKTILIVTHDTPAWLIVSAALGLDRKGAIIFHGQNLFLQNAEAKEVKLRILPRNEEFEIDLHRPFIDGVKTQCACGGSLKRVSEVFDCWYESGSMPFASTHYPFDKSSFNPGGFLKKSHSFPANFIAEGQDQTRGWFYTMLILGVALFGKSPYENVIVNGIVLAEDGQKMSKRLRNYPDPMEVVDKYGMDALRYYLLASPVVKAQDLCFSEKGVDEVLKKVFNRLDNVLQFYLLYSSSLPTTNYEILTSPNVLDIWILARLNETADVMTKAFESYELDKAVRPIGDFVEDLSTWYLRRSRDRFKAKPNQADSVARSAEGGFRGEDVKDKNSALQTTRFVLAEFSKLIAPIAPFFAEYLYSNVKGASEVSSVHLATWPTVSLEVGKSKGLEVLAEMSEVRKVVSLGLEARAKANIKVRQPLAKLTFDIHGSKIKDKPELLSLIVDEVNVKAVIWGETGHDTVELDTNITPELKEEGSVRDLVRAIQELRKQKNLNPSDIKNLSVATSEVGQTFLKKYEKEITSSTGTKFNFVPILAEGTETVVDGLVFRLDI